MKVILLFLSLIVFSSYSLTVSAQASCAKVLIQKIKGSIRDSGDGSLHFIFNDLRRPELLGKEVGVLEYDLLSDGKTLYISWMDVNPSLRNSGVSTQLIEELLRNFPETKKISGYLTDTNLAVYKQNLNTSHDPVKALMATPYYRTFSNFGFTHIIQNSFDSDRVVVVLGK